MIETFHLSKNVRFVCVFSGIFYFCIVKDISFHMVFYKCSDLKKPFGENSESEGVYSRILYDDRTRTCTKPPSYRNSNKN